MNAAFLACVFAKHTRTSYIIISSIFLPQSPFAFVCLFLLCCFFGSNYFRTLHRLCISAYKAELRKEVIVNFFVYVDVLVTLERNVHFESLFPYVFYVQSRLLLSELTEMFTIKSNFEIKKVSFIFINDVILLIFATLTIF